MELNLYFVSGLNRVDTLYFDNLTEQENYFTNHVVTSIADFSFYPPHYQNSIRLTTDDINFKSKVNYLSLTFNDKTYYYFIDNINYISEDVVSFDITMDVIQTYMFDINFIHSDIERNTIKRYNGSSINRDYIRENISNSDFVLSNYEVAKSNKGFIILDIATTQDIIDMRGDNEKVTSNLFPNVPTSYRYGNKVFNDGLLHFFIIYPLTMKDIHVENIDGFEYSLENKGYSSKSYTQDITYTALQRLIEVISKQPQVVSINACPFNIFENCGLTFNETGSTITISKVEGGQQTLVLFNVFYKLPYSETAQQLYLFQADSQVRGSLTYATIDMFYTRDIYDISKSNYPYGINYDRMIEYNIKYLPQMFDENYRIITYGERISNTSFPISQSTRYDELVGSYYYIISNGNRAYSLNVRLSESFDVTDPHITTIVVPTSENIQLKNDAWTSYISQNRATLTTGLAYQYFNDGVSMIENIASNRLPTRIFDRRYKSYPKLNKAGKEFTRGVTSSATQGALGFLDTYMNYEITKENLKKTPNTLTQGNNIIDMLMLDSNKVVFRDYVVRDYEMCASYFEAYGFKVHLHYDNENLFNVLNNRVYYNYIKTSDISITLETLNDNETIDEIEERFNNGLRLWNVKECDEDGLGIGEMFKYDNADKS